MAGSWNKFLIWDKNDIVLVLQPIEAAVGVSFSAL
jgi:hypothetical protein